MVKRRILIIENKKRGVKMNVLIKLGLIIIFCIISEIAGKVYEIREQMYSKNRERMEGDNDDD